MNREALVNMRIHSHEISPLQNKHAKQYSTHCKQYFTNCKQYNTHCKLGQNFEEKIDVYCTVLPPFERILVCQHTLLKVQE